MKNWKNFDDLPVLIIIKTEKYYWSVFKLKKRKRITYEELEEYKEPKDVPLEKLKEWGIYNPDKNDFCDDRELFDKDFYAIKEGYSSYQEYEDDMKNMMYPEGYDPDTDGNDILPHE